MTATVRGLSSATSLVSMSPCWHVHHLERGTASFRRRRQAHEQQIIKIPFGRSPRKRQHRGNGGQTGEFSKTRLLIAHRICAARQQLCTAIRSTVVLTLAARPLADHFSPSPMVGSRGSAAPALIPAIRAGRLVHVSSPGVTAMVQNLVTGLVVVALIIMGVLAYAQKHEGCLHGRSLQTFKPCGSVSVVDP